MRADSTWRKARIDFRVCFDKYGSVAISMTSISVEFRLPYRLSSARQARRAPRKSHRFLLSFSEGSSGRKKVSALSSDLTFRYSANFGSRVIIFQFTPDRGTAFFPHGVLPKGRNFFDLFFQQSPRLAATKRWRRLCLRLH